MNQSKSKSVLSGGLLAMSFLFSSIVMAATVVVEGPIDKVVPEKREIYVIADGKKHEFYFNEKTELLKGAAKAEFADLKKAMNVRVTANKVGKRLDPLKVEILTP